jgi:hypothetical protein
MTARLPARDARGRLLPGGPGLNPGGRALSSLAKVRALLEPNVELYVERLNELVRNPDPDIALPALKEAFDRLLGKAVAVVEQDVRTMDVNEAIRQMWLQAAQAAGAERKAALEVDDTKIVEARVVTDERGRR